MTTGSERIAGPVPGPRSDERHLGVDVEPRPSEPLGSPGADTAGNDQTVAPAPEDAHDELVSLWRLALLLTLGALVAPTLTAPIGSFTDRGWTGAALVAGTALLFVGAMLRVNQLVRTTREIVRQERVLRSATAALAAAAHREDAIAAVLEAVDGIAPDGSTRCWLLSRQWQHAVVTATNVKDQPTSRVALELLDLTDDVAPRVVGRASGLYHVLDVDPKRHLAVVPLPAQAGTTAVLAVDVARSPSPRTLQTLQALALIAAQAFERLDLDEVRSEQRSERRLRQMLQHASDVICLLDPDLTVCFVTPAVEQVLGIPAPELLGENWLDLVAPGGRAGAHDLVLRAQRGRPTRGEVRLLTVDGRERTVDTAIIEVNDEGPAGFVLTAHDVTEQRQLEEQLTHQAFHDSLTGLANRALFGNRVEHALARSKRSGETCAVLFIDLDDFKTVNDSLGHAAGDELLGEVTGRLSAGLRDGDTAARLGGDEFAVLLEDVADVRIATDVATRILDELSTPITVGTAEVSARASIGIATSEAGVATPADLLRNADLALYEAKNAGKGQFALYAPGMHDAAVERLAVTGELRQALDRGELVVHYQPVMDLDAGDIVGFEALVRWNHPTRGQLLPSHFIGLAEETGLIVPLGRQVMATALADLARWQLRDPSLANLRVAINVSGRQLQEPGIVDEVAEMVSRSGVRPETVVLEITESVLVPGAGDLVERLRALADLGVGVYIDDFGTGYSSLSYLQQLPVNGIKLAQEFVTSLPGTATEVGLVRAIRDLAETLGLDMIVAEGVERAEQKRSLVSLGYSVGQGFHLGRPQPAELIERLLSVATSARPDA